MIRRTQWPDALLAFIASWAALLPVYTLFNSPRWGPPALLLSLVVLVTGMITRAFVGSAWVVAGLQLLVGTEAFVLVHGRGHHRNGLPTIETVSAFNNILYEGRITVASFAAPAPTTRGVIVWLSLLAIVFVLVVDLCAVTKRAPALAGLPLLGAYLLTAVNSGTPLAWYSFALPALAWLILLSRTATGGLRRWPTVRVRPASGTRTRDAADGFAANARGIGVAVLALALAIPAVLPHLPTRFLTDGLGRTERGGGSGGSYALSTTLDLARNLRNPSDNAVLTYRTTLANPGPLRIGVLDDYGSDGNFRPRASYPARHLSPGESLTTIDPQNPPAPLREEIRDIPKVREGVLTATESRLKHPQIALPYGATAVSPASDDARIIEFPDGGVSVSEDADAYTVEYSNLAPTPQLLQRSNIADGITGFASDTVTPRSLGVPETLRPRLTSLLADIVPAGATDFEAAVAIQNYLRSSRFRYSLELIPGGENGQMLDDPIDNFLSTRQGYCQQFASTMVMLARQYGLPARMAIGMLPGESEGGTYTVRASDAHAWPEIYFEPFGWLRFEPTPATRTGTVPSYAVIPTTDAGATPGMTSSSSSSTTRAPQARPDIAERNAQDYTIPDRSLLDRIKATPRWGWGLVAAVLALLAALVLPVAARVSRRRRLTNAADDAAVVEARWQDLLSRVADLGIATPATLTPRQAQEHLAERGVLDADQRPVLGRVVGAVETARYARPGTALADPEADVTQVYDAIAASRSLGLRWRARLVPSAGVGAISGIGRAVTGLPRRLLSELRGNRGRDRR